MILPLIVLGFFLGVITDSIIIQQDIRQNEKISVFYKEYNCKEIKKPKTRCDTEGIWEEEK